LVAPPIIRSCEDRLDYWAMLRGIARVDDPPIDRSQIEQEVRRDVTNRLATGLAQLITGSTAAIPAAAASDTAAQPAAASNEAAVATADDAMAPWIDTALCTACDECTRLNPKIFEYNEQKKAVIKDPQGGPYRDLVKAAERCTAQIIHPGLPRDRSEKDIEKWIARAEKYNR
jgi:pyruvate-ferredoxin/flavodoxin oxidoreductase